jgi:hypothetical protein
MTVRANVMVVFEATPERVNEYRQRQRRTSERDQRIYELRQQGTPVATLSARYGLTRQRIHQIIKAEHDRRTTATMPTPTRNTTGTQPSPH